MRPLPLVAGTVLVAASLGLYAKPLQQPVSQPPAPQGAPVEGRGAQGMPGRGGGRGNPMATKFTEVCATCHGTTQAKGPVGPSLFADTWIHGGDDAAITKSIKEGYAEKGMPAFKDQLTDPEIFQMIAFIRTQTQNLKDKPVYVPDPDGQVVKSEHVTFKMDVVARNLETPWALAFLPDGRLLITERPGRIRIVDKDGKMEPDPVKGLPKV